jgi:hypothetical protein
MTLKLLKARLRAFASDTKGSIAVETAIILPMLIWTYAALFIFFDAYRARSTTEKAAFTISDVLSRETQSIDAAYLSNVHTLFDFLAAQSDTETKLRVSLISWDIATQTYELEWSKTDGQDIDALSQGSLNDVSDKFPIMSDGESLILVQTFSTYEPVFDVGMGDIDIDTFIFTRPRFAPQLVWG